MVAAYRISIEGNGKGMGGRQSSQAAGESLFSGGNLLH